MTVSSCNQLTCHALYLKCSMPRSCITFWSTEPPDCGETGTYPEGPGGIFTFTVLTSKANIYNNAFVAEG